MLPIIGDLNDYLSFNFLYSAFHDVKHHSFIKPTFIFQKKIGDVYDESFLG